MKINKSLFFCILTVPEWGECSFASEVLEFLTDSRVLYLWVKKLSKFYYVVGTIG